MAEESRHTDTTFFTNEQGATLLDRFLKTLEDTRYFDVLVGYFRSSGFYQLYRAIEKVDKTRILVGLGIDEAAYTVISAYQNQGALDFASHAQAKKAYQKNLIKEIENSKEPDLQLLTGVKAFMDLLEDDCPDPAADIARGGNGKKLEIRAYPSKNLHAKVYISRYHEDDKEYGSVITGSSNFSLSGLVANREFNVQLKDRRDVDFALEQFENLWKDGVDISREFVDTVRNRTWLNDTITPYELYLKLIYEYLQEDINLEEHFEAFLPKGFMKLEYQQQAVRQALKKLNEYNGVFLADVVGLGKTFIAAQLLQQVRGRILVICPPLLKEYWEQSLMDFRVPAKVESLGKLEHIIQKGVDRWDYIVVDEAHRFRNDATQSYANLLEICRGKKVILVTATPLNNTINDIFAQLKLFQAPKKSTIPGVPNLENFFKAFEKKLNKYRRRDPDFLDAARVVSKEIREKVLKYVMVRRTRKDVMTFFKADVERQGLFFPEMKDPEKIVYEYSGQVEGAFQETMAYLARFNYARYVPLLYYAGGKKFTEFDKQQQRNVGGFMKSILLKRLESSFFAFKQSVHRFIESYERFIEMYNRGTVYISKKVNVYDLLDNDDIDQLEQAVEEERAQKYETKDFREDYLYDLHQDLNILRAIRELWKNIEEDPKLEKLVQALKTQEQLKTQHLIIFTESKETGGYLYEKLNEIFPGEVVFYSSSGGRCGTAESFLSHRISRDLIKANFDPNSKDPANDLRILITTDVLAEGINLHRSNVLVNYDLPWNPTRVLQRAGRVNRLGTKHAEVYIFNFFPTTHADKLLGLEQNIINKIQMFHDTLGEDAKYLFDGEIVGSRELFDTLNNRALYLGEEEEGDSELKYLEMIRRIRDEKPDLFDRIKKLPKKARSAKKASEAKSDQLITFFRMGPLKKFYRYQDGTSEEITFFDAVNLLECDENTSRASFSDKKYFDMLEVNKARFDLDTTMQEEEQTPKGRSNVKYIERRLKEPSFRRYKGFTDADEEFIAGVKELIRQGLLAKKTAQKIKKELEKETDPLQVLHILRRHIQRVEVVRETQKNQSPIAKEVILSGYLTV